MAGRSLLGLLFLGGAALLLMLIALVVNWQAAIPWSLAMLAVEYLAALYIRGEAAGIENAVYGTGLLLAAELAYWSLQLRIPGRREARLLTRGMFVLAVLVLSSLGIGLLITITITIELPVVADLPLTVVGVAAAAVALALVAAFAWRLGI